MSAADHNQRCRERAAEQAAAGVVATYSPEHRCFVVPSRSRPGRSYHVLVQGRAGQVSVGCSCQAGATQAPLGSTPCWHGAAGCAAMVAAGLVRWDGGAWRLTDASAHLAPVPAPKPVPTPLQRAEAAAKARDHRPPSYGTPEYEAAVSQLVD